jgi:hypothetical protein
VETLEQGMTVRRLFRIAVVGFVRGAATAVGGGMITLLAWWVERR